MPTPRIAVSIPGGIQVTVPFDVLVRMIAPEMDTTITVHARTAATK